MDRPRVGHRTVLRGSGERAALHRLLSSGLLFAAGYWQLAPVLSASFGASLDLRKLVAYPIPRVKLFTVEVLLRILTCAEMLILLACAALGLFAILYTGWVGALHRWGRGDLRGRQYPAFHRSALSFRTAVPAHTHEGGDGVLHHRRERCAANSAVRERAASDVASFRAHADVVALGRRRSADARRKPRTERGGGSGMAGDRLRVWRRQFERAILFDAAGGKKPEPEARFGVVTEFLFRIPARFLPDPVAALIEKELRTLVRISRFRHDPAWAS